jgi:hypothetical protein
MLIVVMMNGIMTSVVMLSVFMLSIVVLTQGNLNEREVSVQLTRSLRYLIL